MRSFSSGGNGGVYCSQRLTSLCPAMRYRQFAAEQALLHGYHVSMIQSFKDKDSAAFFQGRRVRRFEGFAAQARRRLSLLHTATSLADLAGLPSNQLEQLHGDRQGQHSIRINDQWRMCFIWQDDGPHDVEIVDYH